MHALEHVPIWDSIFQLTCKKEKCFFQCMSNESLFYAFTVLFEDETTASTFTDDYLFNKSQLTITYTVLGLLKEESL